MRWWAGFVFASILAAQDEAPLGLVRGVLLEVEVDQFSLRAADFQVFRFTTDSKTYIELDKQRITIARLRKGETVDVVSDRGLETGLRYARLIKVVERQPVPAARPPIAPGRLSVYRSPTEQIVPRGQLTFSGIIVRLTDERLILRTRVDGEKAIRLRRDTQFLEDGKQVERSALTMNTRVFVRGNRDLVDQEIEAYTVIWGEILPGR